MLRVRPDARLEAFDDTTYPRRVAASTTFAFEAGETWPRPLSARETVAVETPASFATSSMPAMRSSSRLRRFDPPVFAGSVPGRAESGRILSPGARAAVPGAATTRSRRGRRGGGDAVGDAVGEASQSRRAARIIGAARRRAIVKDCLGSLTGGGLPTVRRLKGTLA